MTRLPRRSVDVRITTVTRTVGAVHLGAVGLGNLLSGVTLGYLSVTDRLLGLLVPALVRHMGPFEAFRQMGHLGDLVTTFVPLVAAVLVVIGACQIRLARAAFRGRHFRAVIVGAALGVLNLAVAPLALVAVSLLTAARRHF